MTMNTNSDPQHEETHASETVTEYHLEDEEEKPVCFSLLPIKWPGDGSLDAARSRVYLHGSVDDGLRRICQRVVAWKVDIKGVRPKVWVLSKDRRWFKLTKPRRAYETICRGIMVTLKCLIYLRRNPNSSDRSLWENVETSFRHFETRVSKSDLLKHLSLIKMMIKSDAQLSRSQLLCGYLKDLPKQCHSSKKLQKVNFIDDKGSYEDAVEEDKDECCDTVCAMCDDGGEVLCCEGKCLRSFHATRDAAGPDARCKSLGYTRSEVDKMAKFFCPNCSLKKHQCFACGKLGKSDVPNAEVYCCKDASCGHHYHPCCAASLIHPNSKGQAVDLEKRIASGEAFTCSAHKCIICNGVENKNVADLQFAMCRRCPRSYHRKCLPRDISLEDRPEEGIKQRAWDGLIQNRILIYCMRHNIDEDTGTPFQNHVIFPQTVPGRVKYLSDAQSVELLGKRKWEDSSRESFGKRLTETVKRVPSTKEARWKTLPGPVHEDRRESPFLFESPRTLTEGSKMKRFAPKRDIPYRDEKTNSSEMNNNLSSLQSEKLNNRTVLAKVEAKHRIMPIMESAPATSLKADNLLEKRSVLANPFHSDKKITQGRVEGAVEAIRAALQKLEKGCSIEDAQVVCRPDVLKQVLGWKIVERLQWYVLRNDTIVDFSCGANDFSLLMREMLEERGMKCSYKNYDIFTPKNDFNFEKRDWMTIHPGELPAGSRLIMRINSPSGISGHLAKMLVDKALEFKPKLLLFVIAKETERRHLKPESYDLIWEDGTIFSGKERQVECNVEAPSLCLWSHPDWTSFHKAIAAHHGHAFTMPASSSENSFKGTRRSSTVVDNGCDAGFNHERRASSYEQDRGYTLPAVWSNMPLAGPLGSGGWLEE